MSELLDPALLPIKWKEATNLIHAYHNHPDSTKLKTFIKNNIGSETEAVLSGFSLDLDEMEKLTKDSRVKKIFVAIGYHNDLRTEKANGHSGIFFGIDANDNLLYGENDHIFNYSMPCPKNCPKDNTGSPIDFSKIQPIPLPNDLK